MSNSLTNVTRLFKIVSRAINFTDSTLAYDRTIAACEVLCNEINAVNDSDSIWYLEDSLGMSLSDYIPALYWHCVDCHSGMQSDVYRLSCILERLYKPGLLCNGPYPDSAELIIYELLEDFAGLSNSSQGLG